MDPPRTLVLALDFLRYEFVPEIPSEAIPLVPEKDRIKGDQTYAITYDSRLPQALCRNLIGGREDLTEMRAFRNRCATAGVGFVRRPVPGVEPQKGIKEGKSDKLVINAGAAYAYTTSPGPGLKALLGEPWEADIKENLERLVREEKFYNSTVHGGNHS